MIYLSEHLAIIDMRSLFTKLNYVAHLLYFISSMTTERSGNPNFEHKDHANVDIKPVCPSEGRIHLIRFFI